MSTPPSQLTVAIENAEGFRSHAYWDPIGQCWTDGFGQTGTDIGPTTVMTRQEAVAKLIQNENVLISELNNALTWAKQLSAPRFGALIDASYNLGLNGLLAFHEALSAMQVADWVGAVKGFDASLWDHQVRNRVNTICYMILFDVWVEEYLTDAQTLQLNNAA
jgi:lysozyme